ncbi:nucleoside hydrolase [soil metagenome]
MRRLQLQLWCACLVSFVCWARVDAATAVWIDSDPSIGPPWREVDDAFGLLLAFRSPELRIVGISTTYGNVSLPRTTTVARALVQRFGALGVTERQVFAGAMSAADVQRETEASRALRAALQRERNLTYIALGPLTNLAALQRLHPVEARGIARVVVLGGHRRETELVLGPRDWPRIHDANIFKDPAAAAQVLHSGIALTLAPFESSSRFRINQADWRRITRGALGDYLRPRTAAWRWFWRQVSGDDGGPLFDMLPILAVARPDLVGSDPSFATMGSDGALLIEDRKSPGAVEVSVLRPASAAGKRLVIDRLATER